MRRPRGRRLGFTLVELLIVMALLGTLVALLLPAVASALESANAAVCASNLRQIGLAMNAYTGQNDTHFPPSACPQAGAAKAVWWLNALQRYTKTPLLYRCPSDPAPDEAFLDWENPPEGDWLRYRWASYCMNGRMDKAAPYLSQVRRHCRTIVVCEAAASVRGSDHVHPELWLSTQDVRNAVDHKRHNGRSNFLFVDGHVEALPLEDTWNPKEVNLWNPLRAPDWCTPMEY